MTHEDFTLIPAPYPYGEPQIAEVKFKYPLQLWHQNEFYEILKQKNEFYESLGQPTILREDFEVMFLSPTRALVKFQLIPASVECVEIEETFDYNTFNIFVKICDEHFPGFEMSHDVDLRPSSNIVLADFEFFDEWLAGNG